MQNRTVSLVAMEPTSRTSAKQTEGNTAKRHQSYAMSDQASNAPRSLTMSGSPSHPPASGKWAV